MAKKTIFLVMLILIAIESAMAQQSRNVTNANTEAPTREQIVSAINILLGAGIIVIDNENSMLILAEPTILQRLQSAGRVRNSGTRPSARCQESE